MKKRPPEITAKRFVHAKFPCSEAAFLAGSAVTGRLNPGSDLDIVIIDSTQDAPYKLNTSRLGWIIEAFVMTPDTVDRFFEEAQKTGIPTLLRMCAEGKLIKDEGIGETVRQKANRLFSIGPFEWTFAELDNARYEITECLEDLEGSEGYEEHLFTVNQLIRHLSQFILRGNGKWIGAGKWTLRSLEAFDPSLCSEFIQVLDRFFKYGERAPLVAFADLMLAPFGGRLREGWMDCGLPEWDDHA